MATQSLDVQSRYNPDRVAQFFDAFGVQEWYRLIENPTKEVALHVHAHYLQKFVCNGDRVLEVGAGAGRFTQILAELNTHIVVSDISSVQLNLNQQHAEEYRYASSIESW